MGSSGSKEAGSQEESYPTSVGFSNSVISELSHSSNSPGSPSTTPTQSRQEVLDSHIRSKIAREVENLRAEEDEIAAKISAELEKENLDKEVEDGITSSVLLEGDLEEVRRKVERLKEERNLETSWPSVWKARQEVVECYKTNPDRTLDCASRVGQFKEAVQKVERVCRFLPLSETRDRPRMVNRS
ncbi:hypothetical protein BT69DRAFT_757787 [Atractiella rhizophila]|nr:hypothetical protein BT69DRAFT_757787 [Atractiella rhizophila]